MHALPAGVSPRCWAGPGQEGAAAGLARAEGAVEEVHSAPLQGQHRWGQGGVGANERRRHRGWRSSRGARGGVASLHGAKRREHGVVGDGKVNVLDRLWAGRAMGAREGVQV